MTDYTIKIKLLAGILGIIVFALAYFFTREKQKSKWAISRINEEFDRVHKRINNSLDYSHAILQYVEPRFSEILIDESNKLYLPTEPIQPEKEVSNEISSERELTTRERNTLLTIIAVLCKEAKLDHTKHAKTASLILSTAASMGVLIGESTIESHLKKIPNALASRMK